MASSERQKELISTVIMGDGNKVQNTVNYITYVNMASSGERKQTDSSETSSSFPGASNLSSCSGGDMPELITDSSKRDADVRETEIAWLAKEVANNGRHCDKREGLYRRLDIKDQESTKIKQERLDKRSTNIEDEIFKVINNGWLQQTGVKTRHRLLQHLYTFSKQLAEAYAGFINSCDNFDIGLPLPTPSNNSSYPSMLPSIQGTSCLQSFQNAPHLLSTALTTLSIQGPSSLDGSQLVARQPEPSDADGGQGDPNSILASQLGCRVEEREVVWLSGEVARNHHTWNRNSLYRHLTILDSEVERIKYEKLGDDRNIENEVFKVVKEGWCEQDLDRTRALMYRQLYSFKPLLAERYLKHVSGQL